MFPSFNTKHFLLRQITQADQAKIFEGLSHPDVIPFYGISFRTYEETQAQMDWYKQLTEMQTGIWWGICQQDNPSELIGACGFNNWRKEHQCIEIGFWLMPDHWKKGIMRECIPVIIHYAFSEMNVHRIEAVVETGNQSSSRLLQNLGFFYEGTHRECEIKNGRFISLEYFAFLNIR